MTSGVPPAQEPQRPEANHFVAPFALPPLSDTSHQSLETLLQHRNLSQEYWDFIDNRIRQTFGDTRAILVLDLAGFSRLTLRHGIIHFLAILQRLRVLTYPVIATHQGTLIKQDADNLFVTFKTVKAATEGAIAILQALQKANKTLPDSQDMEAGIGIGYGELLVVENADVFGSEMNLASKLGEDLARPGEILLTDDAYQRLCHEEPTLAQQTAELSLSVSGLTLTVHQLMVRGGRLQPLHHSDSED